MKYLYTLLVIVSTATFGLTCPISNNWDLQIDCENEMLVINNYPANGAPGFTFFETKWKMDYPSPIVDTTVQSSFNSSPNLRYQWPLLAFRNNYNLTYEVTITFIYNGVTCTFTDQVYVPANYCCNLSGAHPVASAHFANIEDYTIVRNTPYGDMTIPFLCNLTLDASASKCESQYYISISQFNPSTWSSIGSPLYANWFTGQAPNNINLNQYASFQPGNYYMLQFTVGPPYQDVYILFQNKGASVNFQYVSPSSTYQTVSSPFGNMEIPVVCHRNLIFDGSVSSCEQQYTFDIEKFNISTWTVESYMYSSGWITNQAPSSINLASISGVSYLDGQTYHIRFAVGLPWAEQHIFFKYQNCRSALQPLAVNLYPNPTKDIIHLSFDRIESGRAEIFNANGQIILSRYFEETDNLEFDLAQNLNGLYFVRIILSDGIITQKILKE